jgi:hypothetical protein
VFCRAEHERFVEDTNAPKLDFEFLYPGSEGAGLLVEIRDADGGTLEDRCLGRLLVGRGKSRLETVIALPEFVATALLRFDALLADIFTTALWLAITGGVRGKVVVFLKVTEVVFLLRLPCGSPPGRPRGAGSAGISAVAMNQIASITLWGPSKGRGAGTGSWGVMGGRWRGSPRRTGTATNLSVCRGQGRSRMVMMMPQMRKGDMTENGRGRYRDGLKIAGACWA